MEEPPRLARKIELAVSIQRSSPLTVIVVTFMTPPLKVAVVCRTTTPPDRWSVECSASNSALSAE
jgi:hypothetical protein